jgi:hypothetical protein
MFALFADTQGSPNRLTMTMVAHRSIFVQAVGQSLVMTTLADRMQTFAAIGLLLEHCGKVRQ